MNYVDVSPSGIWTARCPAVEDTESVAGSIAAHLVSGDLLLLYGELGAGKTAFVRGLAAGLGADPEDVSSPTFTIMQEYNGRVRLRHLDLYRLESRADIDDLDIDGLRDGAIVVCEWAERLDTIPGDAWQIAIAAHDDEVREIRITPPGGRAE